MTNDRTNIAYVYDGSFYGMLCCAFEALLKNELPLDIRTDCGTLFPVRHIETEADKAEKLLKNIPKRICPEAAEYVRLAYLTCLKDKETAVIRFLRRGLEYGEKIKEMLADADVMALADAVRKLTRERAKFVQFIRFSEVNGTLITQIAPENNVLPLLAGHFAARFPNENFMIYDKTRAAALLHTGGELSIVDAQGFEMAAADDTELGYRRLWKMFYNTIAIKERENPRCRMNFMPKKYWKNMTEFSDV